LDPLSFTHGPGARYVVFLSDNNEYEIYSSDLVRKILKYKNYIEEYGGVTFVCDNLNQKEFLIDCLKIFKNTGINTCLEVKQKLIDDEINSLIDLVI
jgi:pyruvate-formate lyase-activating enzyme